MRARDLVVAGILVATSSAAKPPVAWKCPDRTPDGCICPAGSVSARDNQNQAFCAKKVEPVRPRTPPPPPDTATCKSIAPRVARNTRFSKDVPFERLPAFYKDLAEVALETCTRSAWTRTLRDCFDSSETYACIDKLSDGDRGALDAAAAKLRPPAPKPADPDPPEPTVVKETPSEPDPELRHPELGGARSKTLERSLKLYDKQDYYSGSIELFKVLNGETGDSAVDKQLAELMMVKTLAQLGFYVPAFTYAQQILSAGVTHRQYSQTVAFVLSIVQQPQAASALPRDLMRDIDQGIIEGEALATMRDEARFYLGRAAIAEHPDIAIKWFAAVSELSSLWPRARKELALLRILDRRTRDVDAGVQFATDATRDPASGNDAIREVVVFATSALAVSDDVKRLVSDHANLSAAAFASSRFAIEEKANVLDGVPTRLLEGLVVATTCFKGPSKHILGDIDFQMIVHLDRLLGFEDNAQVAIAAREMMDSRDDHAWAKQYATPLFLRFLLDDPITREKLAFVLEIEAERKHLQESDKAWQTTQIAIASLQELELQYSLAQSDLGKRIRNRLIETVQDANKDETARVIGPASPRLTAGPSAAPGAGFVVTAEACRLVKREPGSSTVLPAAVGRRRGCCSAATPDPAIALAVVALFVRRRKRRS